MEKTNVVRMLDQKHISYVPHRHLDTGAVSGADVAFALGEDPARVFKTLVATGKTGRRYVFLPPVTAALD